MVVSLWWVTYPSEKGEEWSHSLSDLPRGRNGLILWVTYPGKTKWRMVLFFGWPTQKKNGGLIVMGDLPKWKRGRVVSFFGWPTQGEEWSHSLGDLPRLKKNGEWSHSLGDLPRKKWWSHCDGWPTQVEKWKNGLIMMGDLPRWKEYEMRSHCNGWPTQMENMWSVVSL